MNAFPRELLADLRCPCCGSALAPALDLAPTGDGIRDGTLKCDCYEYPVVSGIAVLRQIGPVSSTQNEAVQRLRLGDAQGALRWLLSVGSAAGVPAAQAHSSSMLGRMRARFQTQETPAPEDEIIRLDSFEATLRASRPRGYADYLMHRYANPSFLGAIAPMIVLGDACARTPRPRLLDLLCGTGHSSSVFRTLCPQVETVMADADYVNLFIARRYLAPGTAAVCVDVELPLPFADAAFSGLFLLDGFHYVRSKVALLGEVDRVLASQGAWVFAHMHNADGNNVNPGAPLTATGYAKRVRFGQQRLLPETKLVEGVRRDGVLDLTNVIDVETLKTSDALTLIGARDDSLWRAHAPIDEAIARRADLLALNPLYRVERAGKGLLARAAWPSESLQKESSAALPMFSDTVELDAATLQQIAVARAGGGLSEQVRKLVRTFVLVCLPECYPRVELGTGES
jgi:SAM-dependent methyltransferase